MSQPADLPDEMSDSAALAPPRMPSFDAAPVSSSSALTADREALAVRHEAARLGAFLFVTADGVFFAALLIVVGVVLASHPEVFSYGRYFLDVREGVVATCVLVMSCLSATLAVRFVATHQRRSLLVVLGSTFVLAAVFLVLQTVEFSGYADRGLLPGAHFLPTEEVWETMEFKAEHPEASRYASRFRFATEARPKTPDSRARRKHVAVASSAEPTRAELEPLVVAGALGDKAVYPAFPSQPRNAHVFFGLHILVATVQSLHVLFGVVAAAWLFARVRRGWLPDYYGAVDRTALYFNLTALMRVCLVPFFYFVR